MSWLRERVASGRLMLLLLGVTLVTSAALCVLAWRLSVLDRALREQLASERLEQAADLGRSAILEQIGATAERLGLVLQTPPEARPARLAELAEADEGRTAVDFARGEVRRSGRRLDVSALEFKLLQTFIQYRGRLLSREQLLDQVWGHGISVTERVVDNQVLSLRKKIEPDPAAPRLLVSVRGLGYRFDPDAPVPES